MTDRHQKTIPDDAPTLRIGTASTRSPNPPAAADSEHAADDEKPFDPFKFQSTTMPPGLRAELIQHARNRPPDPAPDDTLPPNHDTIPTRAPVSGGTSHDGFDTSREAEASSKDDGSSQDDAVTIRLANHNLANHDAASGSAASYYIPGDYVDTERLPRALLVHAQRRHRVATVVVLVLATAASVALIVTVWSLQQGHPEAPVAPAPTPNATVANAAVANASALAPAAPPASATDRNGAAPAADVSTVPKPNPSSRPFAAEQARLSGAPLGHHEGAATTSRPGAQTQSPSSNATKTASPPTTPAKAPSTTAKSNDLLDFAGPAPK
jgi:hypothetical protein